MLPPYLNECPNAELCEPFYIYASQPDILYT
jgi:hypothetical protein